VELPRGVGAGADAPVAVVGAGAPLVGAPLAGVDGSGGGATGALAA